ncbi:MAG: hypothetical protein Q9225_002943 [Loekoesia sp. 1 TL-2023]
MGSIQENNLFEALGFDWDSYVIHRPASTEDFYQLIYDHHRTNGGEFNLAHDIDSGPGNIAEQVGKTFKRVHASEPSSYHASVAEHRLKAIDPDKFSTQKCRGEDISNAGHKHGSVDLITTIFNQILSKTWDPVRPMKGSGLGPANIMLRAFLDNVAFPKRDWKQVRRLMWNYDKPMMFLEDDDVD